MRRAQLVVTALAALAGLLVLGSVAGAANGNGKSSLPGSAPGWAKKSNLVGAADPNGAVGFRVYLGWTDPTGAEALANAVSDPKSASYGKYVTPQDFRKRF